MNIKKVISIIVAILLAALGLFIYSGFFGNPVSYIKSKVAIENYINKHYKNILRIEKISYNWKMGGYSASVVDTKNSSYSASIEYASTGYISDYYHFYTMTNMTEEIKNNLDYMIEQFSEIENEDMQTYVQIEIPKFKYRIFDKYSKKEPIELEIWLNKGINKFEGDKATSLKTDDLYKDKEEFSEDAYKIIKVLQDTGYKYKSINIYSYLENGNDRYNLELSNIDEIKTKKEVSEKVFIKASEK